MIFFINGVKWYLEFVPCYSNLLVRNDGSRAIGVTDNSTHMIHIDETLNDKLLEKVLRHELTHAVIFSYGARLDLMQEELLASLMATYGQEIIETTNKIFKELKGED